MGSEEDIIRLCNEAKAHQFHAVCVAPYHVTRAVQTLAGSGVKVATVVSYPYGYSDTATKVAEVRRAMEEGAEELDIVINLAAVRSRDWAHVRNDIDRVVTAVRLKGGVSKIIIEISQLSQEEHDRVVDICNAIKPHFVKTGTGTRGGATVEDVTYLRGRLHPDIRIKASGGIRSNNAAAALVASGASRLGSSSGVALLA